MDSGKAETSSILDSTAEFTASIHHIQNILCISGFDLQIVLVCLYYIIAFLVRYKNFQEKYFQETSHGAFQSRLFIILCSYKLI